MSEKITVESPPSSVTRRHPLLTTKDKAKNGRRRGSRMGEASGECAAVCCCCPCAVAHLLILAVYRVPRGIWRKKKRKSWLRKKKTNSSEEKENQRGIHSLGFFSGGGDDDDDDGESTEETVENDAVEWDNEMWDRFGAGFWRSGSQRKDD